jgi:hypothetical protein
MPTETLTIEDARSYCERMLINAQGPKHSHKYYMAGIIETMKDLGIISEETRTILYPEYSS